MTSTLATVGATIAQRTGHSPAAMTQYAVETAYQAFPDLGCDLTGATEIDDEQAGEILDASVEDDTALLFEYETATARSAAAEQLALCVERLVAQTTRNADRAVNG